jgi:hypothetical protein
MNRFARALQIAAAPIQVSVKVLAQDFLSAVEQAELEESDPLQDPAVIVLGSFIAFHVHADVNTAQGYHHLLTLCTDEAARRSEFS